MKKGADLGTIDLRTGKTALHEAALRGYSGTGETLLARGIEKNARDKNGHTALSYALKYGNKTAADVLRKNGVEDIPWESNLDDSASLGKPLKKGEAFIWYLRHSGWAIKTKSALLVFDYWDNDPAPDEKLLANGHIRPEELKDYPVYVFASHDHGDHSNNTLEEAGNDFFPEIDFLAQKGIRPDISFFLNMYGCGSTNPEAFQKGIFYAIDKLKIKSVLPMHAANKEWVYGNLVEDGAKKNVKVQVGAAVNQGDRFFFQKGVLMK